MAEVVFDGVGTPVIDPNITGAEVNTTPGNYISDNATSPKEEEFGGVGTPVAVGSRPDLIENFDNEGKNVSYGAPNAIFDNSTSPTEDTFGTAGAPVGVGNASNNAVGFDNLGKNVTVVPAAGAPTGNDVERKFFTPPINVG